MTDTTGIDAVMESIALVNCVISIDFNDNCMSIFKLFTSHDYNTIKHRGHPIV